MLQSISIKNIVLIDNLELDFKPGFTALTGETGAGKSIILSSLKFLFGKKVDSGFLRFGSDYGEVSVVFEGDKRVLLGVLSDSLGGYEGDEVIVRRRIDKDGKSKAYVNDSIISLKLLEELGKSLIEIHGQNDQSSLTEVSKQREMLDKFAGLDKKLEKLGGIFSELKSVEKDLAERQSKIQKAREEEEYLRHMLDELTQLAVVAGEDEKLAEQRREMMGFEKVSEVLKDAVEELSKKKNVEAAILAAQKILVRAGNSVLDKAIEFLERAAIEVSEALVEIERLGNNAGNDSEKLGEIEERLFKIREVARKYGRPVGELTALRDETAAKLAALKNEEGNLAELNARVQSLTAEYQLLAEEISAVRKTAAKKMEQKLVAELKPLAMGQTKFEVSFQPQTPGPRGVDKVEFLAATNPGTPVGSLAEVASGGEISRFMLALKVVLLGSGSASTIIFDEIDTGTGGSVAAAIGERLAKLGGKLQVFVVTHLPQVAALAEHHLKVSKKQAGKNNVTSVVELGAKERKEELARMLAGAEITDEARAAAGRLLIAP